MLVISSFIVGIVLALILVIVAVFQKRYWLLLQAYLFLGWACLAVPMKIAVPATNLNGMLFLTVSWPLWVIKIIFPEWDILDYIPIEVLPYFFNSPSENG